MYGFTDADYTEDFELQQELEERAGRDYEDSFVEDIMDMYDYDDGGFSDGFTKYQEVFMDTVAKIISIFLVGMFIGFFINPLISIACAIVVHGILGYSDTPNDKT